MNEVEKARAIRDHMLSKAAQCWSYAWPAEFQASELKEAASQCYEQVGRVDISQFTEEQCNELGFGLWDKESNVHLVPLWLFGFIDEGVILTSINGERKIVTRSYEDKESSDYIDNDVRFGCVAWGIVP